MSDKGYTSKQQPMDLDVTVSGIGTSANPESFKDDGSFKTSDASSKADGDNPSIGPSVDFAAGCDMRVKGSKSGGDGFPGLPGMP